MKQLLVGDTARACLPHCSLLDISDPQHLGSPVRLALSEAVKVKLRGIVVSLPPMGAHRLHTIGIGMLFFDLAKSLP